MKVFYLPGYSPELNPEVRLNADLKHAIRSKVPVRTKSKRQAATKENQTLLPANRNVSWLNGTNLIEQSIQSY